jgi:hypothetical protein
MSNLDIALRGCTCDHGIGGCSYCVLVEKQERKRKKKQQFSLAAEKAELDKKLLDRDNWTQNAIVRESTYCFLSNNTYPLTTSESIQHYFNWLNKN